MGRRASGSHPVKPRMVRVFFHGHMDAPVPTSFRRMSESKRAALVGDIWDRTALPILSGTAAPNADDVVLVFDNYGVLHDDDIAHSADCTGDHCYHYDCEEDDTGAYCANCDTE